MDMSSDENTKEKNDSSKNEVVSASSPEKPSNVTESVDLTDHLDEIPAEFKQLVMRMQSSVSNARHSPLLEKFNDNHIQYLRQL